MKQYDEKAAAVLREWTEKEYRRTVGASPRSEVTEDNEFNPRGPHRWFLEALAFISAILAMQKPWLVTAGSIRIQWRYMSDRHIVRCRRPIAQFKNCRSVKPDLVERGFHLFVSQDGGNKCNIEATAMPGVNYEHP
jgi:hypothetical protein